MKRNCFGDWIRSRYDRPEEEKPDEWAERVIVLPRGNAVPGKLSLSWMPFLRKPLRDLTDDRCQEMTACCSSQVGKTMMAIIINLYCATVLKRPTLHVMPKDEAATSINVERYQTIIEASDQLSSLLDRSRKKEMKMGSLRLGGIWTHFVGARSATDLSARSKGVITLDECDKYEEWTGREADPIELAKERAKTFADSFVFKCSTPTTEKKYIWPELLASTNERYYVPCPRCGEYQELVMEQLKWPKNVRDSAEVLDGSLAWYQCIHCDGRIESGERDGMNQSGIWVPKGMGVRQGKLEGKEPSRRRTGYHLWAAYSPWTSFHQIAAKFLECFQNGRPMPRKLMNFRNSWQGLPWQETKFDLEDEALKSCIAPYYQKQLPDGAKWIIVTVDVQSVSGAVYVYYVVRAWGLLGRSWLLEFGRKESWEEVADLLRSTYVSATGKKMEPDVALIDSGYRTSEVYDLCARTGAWAVKGSGNALAHQREKTVEASGYQVKLVTIDSDYHKDKLHRWIREGEKRWALPLDLPGEYFDHMVAEQKVQVVNRSTGRVRFVWTCVPPGASNHGFDAECYQVAACELLQLETRAKGDEEEEASEPVVIKEEVFQ